MEILDEEQLARIRQLSHEQKVELLAYLCGYCSNDPKFNDGVNLFLEHYAT